VERNGIKFHFIVWIFNDRMKLISFKSPSSTGQNVEIVMSDVMIGVQTPIPLPVCEFTMVLPFRLSTKTKKNETNFIPLFEKFDETEPIIIFYSTFTSYFKKFNQLL